MLARKAGTRRERVLFKVFATRRTIMSFTILNKFMLTLLETMEILMRVERAKWVIKSRRANLQEKKKRKSLMHISPKITTPSPIRNFNLRGTTSDLSWNIVSSSNLRKIKKCKLKKALTFWNQLMLIFTNWKDKFAIIARKSLSNNWSWWTSKKGSLINCVFVDNYDIVLFE